MTDQFAALLLLTGIKCQGSSYKKFAADAKIDINKLYECSSPKRYHLMTQKLARQILEAAQLQYPELYDKIINGNWDALGAVLF